MNQTIEAGRRDNFVHFFWQARRTQARNVTEEVVMTEAQKGTSGVARMEMHVMIDVFLTFKIQMDVHSETRVHTNTQLTWLMEKNQERLRSTSWKNGERQMQLLTKHSANKSQFQVGLHHIAIKYYLKGKTLTSTLGVIQTGSENSEIQTLQHSVSDSSNGSCGWKNNMDILLDLI